MTGVATAEQLMPELGTDNLAGTALTPEQMATVQRIYDEKIRPLVHQLW